MTEKRKRGRPRGPSKDDQLLLAKIADDLVADPSLKPTTAMRRRTKGILPCPVRRLQGRWKDSGEQYLAAAHARRKAATERAQERSYHSGPAYGVAGSFDRLSRQMAAGEPPYGVAGSFERLSRQMAEQINGTAFLGESRRLARLVQDTIESPALREARRVLEQTDSIRKATEAAYGAPLHRMMEDMEREHRRIREMLDPTRHF